MREVLGDDVSALYLGGSFSTGDFVESASDYDVLVVIRHELAEDEVVRVRAFHMQLAHEDRRSLLLEGDYAPRDALVPAGTTRPAWWFRGGELLPPQHMLSADNIANMRADGIVVFGPPAREVLPEVTPADVRRAVRANLAEEPDLSSEASAARELLGIARSLAAIESGRPTSNAAGLRWALARADERRRAFLRRAEEVRAGSIGDPTDLTLRRAVRTWRAELGLPH